MPAPREGGGIAPPPRRPEGGLRARGGGGRRAPTAKRPPLWLRPCVLTLPTAARLRPAAAAPEPRTGVGSRSSSLEKSGGPLLLAPAASGCRLRVVRCCRYSCTYTSLRCSPAGSVTLLATNSLFNFSFVRTEGSSRNSGISAAATNPLPRSPRTRRSRRRARSSPGGGVGGRATASESHSSRPGLATRSTAETRAHKAKPTPDTKAPAEQAGPSAAKPGIRTNPSAHPTAKGEQPLRPRPKNERRHWPAAGGSAAVIGGTPRAGSISRGALLEVVETQFKSRSGGSSGAWLVPVSLFLLIFLRVAIRDKSYCFLCAVSSPSPCWRSSFSLRGRSPANGPDFTAAARTRAGPLSIPGH